MMRSANIQISVFALGGFLLFSALGQAQEKKLEPLNVAYAFQGPTHSPLWIAKDSGLFDKYGLDVMLTSIYGALTVNALLAGDVHVSVASSSATVAAASKGAPIVLIGAFGFIPFKLVAQPSITSIQELKGKIIGSSPAGSSPYFGIRRLLPRLGLNPDRDVTIIQGAPGNKERLQVMVMGKIDATVAASWDISELAMAGHKVSVLADLPQWGLHISGNAISTTRQFLKNHRHRVKAFLMATSEAIWLGRSNKAATFQILRKHLKIEDPKLLEILHKEVMLGSMYPKPYIREEAVEFEIESLSASIPVLRDMKASDFMDSTLLREIEDEGFFTKLHR